MKEDKIEKIFNKTEKVLMVLLIASFAVWMFHHFITPII